MRRLLAAIVAIPALAGACAGSPSKSTSATTPPATNPPGRGGGVIVVGINAIAFQPGTITIAHGQTVQWRFDDDAIVHNVVGSDFRSADMSAGAFSHTFTKGGTFPYQCTLHAGMTGTVVVR